MGVGRDSSSSLGSQSLSPHPPIELFRPSQNPTLCSLCASMLKGEGSISKPISNRERSQNEKYEHHYPHHDLENLELSTKHGCQICARVLVQLSNGQKQRLNSWADNTGDTYSPDRGQYLLFYGGTAPHFEMEFTYFRDSRIVPFEDPDSWIFVFVDFLGEAVSAPKPLYPFLNLEHDKIIPKVVALDQSWPTVMQWLQDCDSAHPNCIKQAERSQGWMPTRLLGIGSMSNKYVRLYETKAMLPVTFTTLSHCWGNLPMQQLLTTNLDSFREGICENELPQTFQEAFAVTRKLRVLYIWIDSLCIIQDSDDDWRVEAPCMSQIYGSSFLNLAASASKDGSGGLFRDRNPSLLRQCCVRTTLSGRAEETYFCGDHAVFRRDFEQSSPLHARAWVQQELYLSRRTLHFGSAQLYWQCKDSMLYERSEEDSMAIQGPGPFNFTYRSWNWMTQEQLDAEWTQLVEDFTTRELTVASDKLMAISGVAMQLLERYREMFVDTRYIAGIWTHNAECNLLWQVVDDLEHRPPRSLTCQAPSFSWASVDSEISFAPEIGPHTITILELNADAILPERPTGAVRAGILRIEASACWIRLRPRRRSATGYEVDAVDVEDEARLFGLDWVSFDTKTEIEEFDKWLFVPWHDDPGLWPPDQCRGLLLQPAKAPMGGSTQDAFQRVACFHTEFRDAQKRQPLLDMLKHTRRELIII